MGTLRWKQLNLIFPFHLKKLHLDCLLYTFRTHFKLYLLKAIMIHTGTVQLIF